MCSIDDEQLNETDTGVLHHMAWLRKVKKLRWSLSVN